MRKIEKVNNITFMTPEKNGIPTGKKNWKGEPEYVYLPDFDEMIKNASCEEEVQGIKEVMDMVHKGIMDGFAFEVVYMVYTERWDGLKGGFTGEMCWQMFQHPWYVEGFNATHVEKQRIIDEINGEVQAC